MKTRRLRDGYITGTVTLNEFGECTRCHQDEVCVYITAVHLPEGVKPEDKRIIVHVGDHIGITCGDYAKFHRQMAHIADRMKR